MPADPSIYRYWFFSIYSLPLSILQRKYMTSETVYVSLIRMHISCPHIGDSRTHVCIYIMQEVGCLAYIERPFFPPAMPTEVSWITHKSWTSSERRLYTLFCCLLYLLGQRRVLPLYPSASFPPFISLRFTWLPRFPSSGHRLNPGRRNFARHQL